MDGHPGGTTRLLRPGFVALALATPFAMAVVGFFLGGLMSGSGVETVSAFLEQAGERRLNPLIAGVLGLAPVILLLLILAVGVRFTPRAGWGPAAAWGGLVPIAVLELWAHLEVWSTYFPSRSMPGFPHGLELVIVPIFFAPVGVVFGVLLGLRFGRPRARQAASTGAAPESDR
jgi:hypothetical protein